MNSGGHPQTPAIGRRPLDSCLWGRASMSAHSIPLAPFLPGRGVIMNSGGHPQTPAIGRRPLDSRFWAARGGGDALWTPACRGAPQWGRIPSPWPPSFQEGEVIMHSGGHPQTPAKGRRPLDSRLWATHPGGDALWTPACRGAPQWGRSPSPWPPSFQEGGQFMHSGGHPQTPAKGRRPLDSCFWAAGGAGDAHWTRACRGAPQWGRSPSPWPPSWKEGGVIMHSGGHPQTPAIGQRPLDFRFWAARGGGGRPLDSRLSGRASMGAHTIPLAPFLSGRGSNNELWGTPPDPCHRAAPSGLLLTRARLNGGAHHPPGPLLGRKGK